MVLLDGFLKESPPNKPLLGFFPETGGDMAGALESATTSSAFAAAFADCSPAEGKGGSANSDGSEPLASRVAAEGMSVEEARMATLPVETEEGASSTAGAGSCENKKKVG